MGAFGVAGAKGFGSSNLGFSWGRRLKGVVHRTEATSRRSGSTSRRSRGYISQVAMLIPTSRRSRRVIS